MIVVQPRRTDRNLWRSWILANVGGEIVGIGLATVVGMAIGQVIEQLGGITLAVVTIGAVALAGAVEGSAVGLAQWLALRAALPAITLRAWLAATVAGAVVVFVIDGRWPALARIGEVNFLGDIGLWALLLWLVTYAAVMSTVIVFWAVVVLVVAGPATLSRSGKPTARPRLAAQA